MNVLMIVRRGIAERMKRIKTDLKKGVGSDLMNVLMIVRRGIAERMKRI